MMQREKFKTLPKIKNKTKLNKTKNKEPNSNFYKWFEKRFRKMETIFYIYLL